MPQVYCAGPLFNEPERAEMAQIDAVMRAAGYRTFLPHRDGLEYAPLQPEMVAQGATPADAETALMRAIFHLDVYQLLAQSDAVVVNLNGRVPDEGTVVEAALAWHAGKAIVLYKQDSRSLMQGYDNPMLTGLAGFATVNHLDALPAAVAQALAIPRAERIARTLAVGAALAQARTGLVHPPAVAQVVWQQCAPAASLPASA